MQLEGYNHLVQAEEERNAAERQLEALQKKQEQAIQLAVMKCQQDLQRVRLIALVYDVNGCQSQARNEELQKQLQSSTRQLDKAKEMEEKYLTLWDSVIDLWNKWSQVPIPLYIEP